MATQNIEHYIVFKGRPLLYFKDNNVFVYGNLKEKAYAELVVLKETSGNDFPGPLMVTIKSTDKSGEVLRSAEFKNGLYEALLYSDEQIERYNLK